MRAIEVVSLKKSFVITKRAPGVMGAIKGIVNPTKETVDAVKDVSFNIEEGEIVGFLGPNGAGKTTTLKMLSGILFPTSGHAKVMGFTPFERKPEMLRQMSLVMGNKNQLWWDLPATDSFRVLKELYEVSDADFKARTEYLIEGLEIGDKVNTQVRKLSLGERMKCELVAALIHAPKVLFLDEPTIGLDVVSQKRIREFLKELHKKQNSTIILTSHYMQDVQELCERVIIIDHGSKIFEGTLQSLGQQFSQVRHLRFGFSTTVPEDQLTPLGKIVKYEAGLVTLEVKSDDVARVTAAVLDKFDVIDVAIEEVDIEDIIRELFERKTDVSRETSPSVLK